MNEVQLVRRLERALADDDRTHEMGVRIVCTGDRIVAQGEVASEERRRAVLAVIREAEPGLPVSDQLTLTAEPVRHAAEHERISHDD